MPAHPRSFSMAAFLCGETNPILDRRNSVDYHTAKEYAHEWCLDIAGLCLHIPVMEHATT